MAQVSIKLPGETMDLTISSEAAEGLTKWFEDAPADDVFNATDPRTGTFWVQKRHIVRIVVA